MIDEKRLDELDSNTKDPGMISATHTEMRDLIHLARLGLWAEKYGVPALDVYAMTREAFPEYGDVAREAIAKLSKEKE